MANEDEQFERIPWEQLSPPGGQRKGMVYALAAAIVAAAVSATLARNLGAPAEPVPIEMTTAALAVPTTTVSPPAATVPEPGVWSEADLMAVHPEELRTEAMAVAEWFVSDYFTVDGSETLGAELTGLLPSGAPPTSHPPGFRSFVDWARALTASEQGPSEFTVSLLVRSLAATDGGAYMRAPLRAVEVTVLWTDDGWSITDLPTPTELPAMAESPPWPEQEVTDEVAALAVEKAGPGAVVLGGGEVGGRWRVVVEAVDPIGGRWPMVVWLDPPPLSDD